MTLEYLSGNCLNKYPFVDSCSMVSEEGYTLPNDFIGDVQVKLFHPTGDYRVYLSSFELTSTVVTFHFTATEMDGTPYALDLVVASLVSSLVEFDTLTGFSDDYSLKLSVGSGLISAISTIITTKTWALANAELVTEAIVQPVPRVNSITLYNNGTLFKIVSVSNYELELAEGSNIDFTQTGNSSALDVDPGNGTGLFNPCDDSVSIRTINGLAPNDAGNFLMSADGCYEVKKGFAGESEWQFAAGLTFSNICTPKCTSEQMGNFAHYLNRVKDGMSQLSVEAASIANELKAQIADYIDFAATGKNKPYAKMTYSIFPSYTPGHWYFSIVVGFFNPTTSPIPVTVTSTYPGALVADTTRFKTKDGVTILSAPSFTGVVPCISAARLEYTVFSTGGSASAAGTLSTIPFSLTLSVV